YQVDDQTPDGYFTETINDDCSLRVGTGSDLTGSVSCASPDKITTVSDPVKRPMGATTFGQILPEAASWSTLDLPGNDRGYSTVLEQDLDNKLRLVDATGGVVTTQVIDDTDARDGAVKAELRDG